MENEKEQTISKINGYKLRVPEYESTMGCIEKNITDVKKEIDKVKFDLLCNYIDNEDLDDVIDLINLLIDDYVSQQQLEGEKTEIYNKICRDIYEQMDEDYNSLNDRMNINDKCNDKYFNYIKNALLVSFILHIIQLALIIGLALSFNI